MQNACVECLDPFGNRVDYRNSRVVTSQLPVYATSRGRNGHGYGVLTVPVFIENLKLQAFSKK